MERTTRYNPDPETKDLLYPDVPAQIVGLSITKQTLKNGDLKCELVGVTNVPNLAVLSPQAWTEALFDLLLEMHGRNYDDFSSSCMDAVRLIRMRIAGEEIGERVN